MDHDKQAQLKGGADDPYSRCAARARKLLQPRLQALFESVDDTLFDLAEKAANNALQIQYFDGMREVRKHRNAVEQGFSEALEERLEAFRAGRRIEPEKPDLASADARDMSLVEDRELEEELAISDMIAKGENRLSRPLNALNQRLGAALRVSPPSDRDNPLGPAGLCRAFRTAVHDLDIETPVLIVIYKLFDKHVVGALGPIYAALNDELIAAGVLPRLSPSVPAAAARAAGRAAAPGHGAPPSPPVAAEPGESPVQSGLLASILELLSGRRTGMPPPAEESSLLATSDLLNALHVLQLEPAAAPLPAGQTIKGVVLDQAALLSNQQTAAPAASDEDSIDLVAMLFEFILQDQNLPDAMQLLLSRLQIPYIKAALLDQRLFANRDHPARRLLDALAEASVGWSRESDRDERLYGKVTEVVETVLQEFDDDMTTFERLVADFEGFLAKSRRRAEVAEKRTAEATQGRERLQRARQRAAEEIGARLEGTELPKLIEEILRKPWANVLVLTHLRHGEASTEFRQRVKFADDLIWTAAPKTTAGDVARLQSMLPHLAKQLRSGLTMVAYQDEDIAKVFKSLKQLYRSMIDQQYRKDLTMPGLTSKPRPPAPGPTDVVPVALPVAAGGDEIVETEPEAAPKPSPRVDETRLEWVKDLEVGTWFEFRDEDGHKKLRAKLSWKSPITSKFLLVDQKGLKVADKPVEELAREIANGDTVVLEAVPLFQRALGAIAERLRDEKTESDESDDDDGDGDRESARGTA